MGICRICGAPAGLFRSVHKKCLDQEERERLNLRIQMQRQDQITRKAESQIFSIATTILTSDRGYDVADTQINNIVDANHIAASVVKQTLIKAWESVVDTFLADDILDHDKEARLMQFREHFSLTQDELDAHGALSKTAKAGAIRDLLEGKVPTRFSIDGNLSINFLKSEHIIWAFPNSSYLEDKTRRTYVGGSRGISVRVMKGVYYRVGSFKGKALETTERVHVDDGWVVITDKNIYFSGSKKSVRVPYKKIISFEPFSDGFGIMRDTSTAKPQLFVTGDGWFSYNLVTNAAHLE